MLELLSSFLLSIWGKMLPTLYSTIINMYLHNYIFIICHCQSILPSFWWHFICLFEVPKHWPTFWPNININFMSYSIWSTVNFHWKVYLVFGATWHAYLRQDGPLSWLLIWTWIYVIFNSFHCKLSLTMSLSFWCQLICLFEFWGKI